MDNLDNDPHVLLRSVYDAIYSKLDGSGIAAAVLIIAKYQYQSSFVADQEINMLACLTEIMVECNFKLLKPSNAADDLPFLILGGARLFKKKKLHNTNNHPMFNSATLHTHTTSSTTQHQNTK